MANPIRLSVLIDADGKIAKAELRATGKEAKKAGGAIRSMGRAADATSADMHELSAAEAAAARQATGLQKSHHLAAGSVGNLTAQFNDIGIMMMAGQNPLQMAIQQGTQITQVIGPMGARGAVRALGTAFMGLLNPVSLVTIASIAAGGALIGWLRDAVPQARSLEDEMDGLAEHIDAVESASDAAGQSLADLTSRYGEFAARAGEVLRRQSHKARLEANRAVKDVADAISGFVKIQAFSLDTLVYKPTKGGELLKLRNELDLTEAEAIALRDAFYAIDEAQGGDALAASLRRAQEELVRAAGGVNKLEGEVETLYDTLLDAEDKALFSASLEEARAAIDIAFEARAAYEQYYASRIASEHQLSRLRAAERTELAVIYGQYGDLRIAGQQSHAEAQEMLATLRAENELKAATLRYGEDSAEVAALRAEQERAAQEAILATWTVAESLKDEMRAAWEAARDLAQTDMASGIGLAANEAGRLAQNLAIAAGQRMDQLTNNPDFFDPRNEAGTAGVVLRERGVPVPNRPGYKPPVTKPPVGGGSATRAEADAVAELVARLEEQLAVQREMDPVAQEMLRHKEALAEATESERKQVRALIELRHEEAAAMEELAARQELFREASYDALEGLSLRGEDAKDVIDDLAHALGQAALKAIWLGEGRLAGIFGVAGDGGLLGLLFPQSNAAGGHVEPAGQGMVYGAGSGTSDDILSFISAGEFIVNAGATARHRHLLEAINSGQMIGAMARGGYAGGAMDEGPVMPADRPGGRLLIELKPTPQFDAMVAEQSTSAAIEVVGRYDREVAPKTAARVRRNPRRVG